ncbi:aminoglycoside phosphotransferase family protein [Embleya scabrispora]|uniref:aminoglycoside phosphotransferase family protein n=1 Tax=Embleya scabrispora TaxID=159449 RepID=UPI0003727E9F|nr:aminoglycoside phosphotransferase family protein [Embleya scabrispora]MYS86460.1 phosphotransferase [Streptomyces sp. SID5474]
MTSSASLPPDLRKWVALRLAGPITVTDVSWPRDNSLVWRVSTGAEEAYVKLSPTAQAFAREVHAYRHAAEFLGPDEAPRLLAADPGLRAILTSPLPGLIVKDLPLPADKELRVHELAGALLGRWHSRTSSAVSDSAREEAVASAVGQVDDAAARLEHAARLLTDPQRALVEQACEELPQLVRTLPTAFRHGDFAPRNWLWNPDRDTVALLDFERAAHGLVVEEFVWLFATTWPDRPDLKAACLTGFGRSLSEGEQRALTLFTALAATSYLSAGITQQHPGLVTKGQDAFGHLVVSSG